MNRRRMLVLFAFLAVVGASAATALAVRARARPRPNIVLVVVDTLRADHLGAYGGEDTATPYLDRFAGAAVVFDRAYSHAPWTAPAVASLLTGLDPSQHGLTQWNEALDPARVTLAEALGAAGYDTYAVLSHVIFERQHGFDQGFDAYDLTPVGLGDPHRVSTARAVTNLGLAVIDDRQRRGARNPWFLYLHYFDPHDQYLLQEQFPFGYDEPSLYRGEVAWVDLQVGRFLEGLQGRGLAPETIVVVTADHGEEFRDHGGRRLTRTLYEEVVRVPLLVRVPGFARGRVRGVVALSDLAPTLLRLVGLDPPQSWTGRALEVLAGGFGEPEGRQVFLETSRLADKRGLVEDRWKLIVDREHDKVELYDLATDPGERRDLAEREREVRERLVAALEAHHAEPAGEAPEVELSEDVQRMLREMGYLDDPVAPGPR